MCHKLRLKCCCIPIVDGAVVLHVEKTGKQKDQNFLILSLYFYLPPSGSCDDVRRMHLLFGQVLEQTSCIFVSLRCKSAGSEHFLFYALRIVPSLSHNAIFLWPSVASVHLLIQMLSSPFWSAAEELSSLFEKKNFRVRSPCSGKQSILSVRLEQCPLQLNNPFNEYSKFDGKVSEPSIYFSYIQVVPDLKVMGCSSSCRYSLIQTLICSCYFMKSQFGNIYIRF